MEVCSHHQVSMDNRTEMQLAERFTGQLRGAGPYAGWLEDDQKDQGLTQVLIGWRPFWWMTVCDVCACELWFCVWNPFHKSMTFQSDHLQWHSNLECNISEPDWPQIFKLKQTFVFHLWVGLLWIWSNGCKHSNELKQTLIFWPMRPASCMQSTTMAMRLGSLQVPVTMVAP